MPSRYLAQIARSLCAGLNPVATCSFNKVDGPSLRLTGEGSHRRSVHPSRVTSDPSGGSDHRPTWAAKRLSQRVIVEWDLPKSAPAHTQPLCTHINGGRHYCDGVLSLAIGVFVRSLNRLPRDTNTAAELFGCLTDQHRSSRFVHSGNGASHKLELVHFTYSSCHP